MKTFAGIVTSIETGGLLRNGMNSNIGHYYSFNAFKGLGQMYVEGERFTKKIDQFDSGLAPFMAEAIASYEGYNRK